MKNSGAPQKPFRDAKIETMKLDRIIPSDYNPRKDLGPDDEEYRSLRRSIQEFGFVEPFVWNKRTKRLIGGHQRLKVLLEMGVEEAKVVIVDLDEAKEKVLNVALNKIHGEWDDDKLVDVLKDITDSQEDATLTGFTSCEIDGLLRDVTSGAGGSGGGGGGASDPVYKCPKCGHEGTGDWEK